MPTSILNRYVRQQGSLNKICFLGVFLSMFRQSLYIDYEYSLLKYDLDNKT